MIGLFDSGIGGLTVVREYLRRFPGAPFVYLGDTARTPYGNKSPETVTRYALEDADYLVKQGATQIVIACNSASAVATETLREAFPATQVTDVITPAVEDAIRVTRGRVGVIATRATIQSGAYQKQLGRAHTHASLRIFAEACPLLVPLVEEGWLNDAETKRIVRRYLSPLRSANVDTLIIGCTHYPLLAPIIARYMGKRVTLIDPAVSVISRLLTTDRVPVGEGGQRYALTDRSVRSDEIAASWIGRPIRFEQAVLN